MAADAPRKSAWPTAITFWGERPDADKVAALHAADLFVLPSTNRAEAFGIVLIEALAAGTPLISTELGTGTSYVNQHEVTGLVTPPNDPAALAAAINRLTHDDDLRRRDGRRRADSCPNRIRPNHDGRPRPGALRRGAGAGGCPSAAQLAPERTAL